MTFQGAVDYCAQFDAQLVIIANQREQDFVHILCPEDSCWIGLIEINTDGNWQWIDNLENGKLNQILRRFLVFFVSDCNNTKDFFFLAMQLIFEKKKLQMKLFFST